MADAVRCPGCQASLELPSAVAGQTVQCPQCQNVFEPHNPASSPTAPGVSPHADAFEPDEEPLHDRRPICFPHPFSDKRMAIFAISLLGICMISFSLQSFINFKEMQLTNEGWLLPLGRQDLVGGRPEEHELRNLVAWTYVIHDWIVCAALVFFLIWLWQARRNLRDLQVEGMSHRPISVLLAFFIPIVNLYRPYVILQEIWRASHPRAVSDPRAWIETPSSPWIRCCWFFSIIGALPLMLSVVWYDPNLFPNILDHQTVRALQFPIAWILCVANVCIVAAAAFLIVIIVGITRRQQQRYERLYTDLA